MSNTFKDGENFKEFVDSKVKTKLNSKPEIGVWVEVYQVGKNNKLRLSEWLKDGDKELIVMGNEKEFYIFSRKTLLDESIKRTWKTNKYKSTGYHIHPNAATSLAIYHWKEGQKYEVEYELLCKKVTKSKSGE